MKWLLQHAARLSFLIPTLSCGETPAESNGTTDETECVISIHNGAHAPAGCPSDAPICPLEESERPSYERDVAPLVAASCVTCHKPGGLETGYLLDTYEGIARSSSDIAYSVSACKMPPANCGFSFSNDDRRVFLAWLACGFQNN